MTLILSGTDGLSDVDGSAATPAIRGTDANTGIFFPAADTIAFSEGGAEVARFDSSGNMGLGVTPSAWNSDYRALDVASYSNLFGRVTTPSLGLALNCYRNSGGSWIYKNTSQAARYEQDSGLHLWFTAASGTAGNTISFTTAMSLDTSSNLSVAGTITSGKGADVASTGSMTLGAGNFFDITGTTTISNIAIKPAGTVVYLKFAGTVNLQTGTIGNSGAMRLTGGATLVVTQYDVLTLISDGTNWWQVAVNNN